MKRIHTFCRWISKLFNGPNSIKASLNAWLETPSLTFLIYAEVWPVVALEIEVDSELRAACHEAPLPDVVGALAVNAVETGVAWGRKGRWVLAPRGRRSST